MLLVALSCGRLHGILDIASRYSFVAFGTMHGKILADLTASVISDAVSVLPVYFYETG